MMMLVQSGECCAPSSARGTFALSSILGYRKISILAISNLNAFYQDSAQSNLQFGRIHLKNFNMATMGSHTGYPNTPILAIL